MKVTYLGDGADETTVAFGIEFKRGEAVEVDERKVGPVVVRKLSNNPVFKVDGVPKPEKPAS